MANKFITLLEKIGHDFKIGVEKALQIEAKALPAEQAIAAGITLVDPAIGTTISEILRPIAAVEQVATAVNANKGTGEQKLEAALPQVEQVIASDPLFAGKIPADLEKYNKAIATITGAFADLLNSFAAPGEPEKAAQ